MAHEEEYINVLAERFDTIEEPICEHCGMEYVVAFNSDDPSSFCPFCGEFLDGQNIDESGPDLIELNGGIE